MTTFNPDNDPLENALKGAPDDSVPPEIQARARRHLDALRERMETQNHGRDARATNYIFGHWGRRLAWAVPLAALLFVIVFFGGFFGKGDSNAAWAAVVRQVRNIRTLTFLITVKVPPNPVLPVKMPDMRMAMMFKEPGLMRITAGSSVTTQPQAIQIMDRASGKGIILMPPTHNYMEANTTDSLKQIRQQTEYIENLRKLPDHPSADLGTKEIDGRPVRGYQVDQGIQIMSVWIDPATRQLVQVDSEIKSMPGVKSTMSHFIFDAPLNQSLFDITPPAGYEKLAVTPKMSEIAEADLVEMLRLWADGDPDGLLPPTLQPMELPRSMLNRKPKVMSQSELMDQTLKLTRGMVFATMMKPANDFHYSGKGIKLGEKDKPVAWWKPNGAANYRVVYADLTAKDVAPAEIPKIK